MSITRMLLSLGLILGACTTFNQENYTECLPLVEIDRQAARVQKDYSYDAVNFSYCRAPARYKNQLEEE
ncbi:MAG: hypothetical protein HN867_01865 [Deltaproteobacteria bacterium]|jgi:hypothetical protein|nr:hypothetical protein [Deltaproteobacteria bacterium]MBT7202222.1 hypothetical protein [Deltaproteobacteria bacterium]